MKQAKSFHDVKYGNFYTICPIEGSNRFVVIKNGKHVRYTEDYLLYETWHTNNSKERIINMFKIV